MTHIYCLRDMPREYYRHLQRLARCSQRAIMEGGFDDRMMDMVLYGTALYTPEQQKKDAERAAELMRGIKKQ